MLRHHYIQICLYLSIAANGCHGLQCYACSYQYNSIKLGYACATSPWNVTTAHTTSCNSPSVCYTKTVYTPGYGRIQSVFRTCGIPETFSCGQMCCHDSVYDRTCQSVCNTDYCNNKNVYRAPQKGSGNDARNSQQRTLAKFLTVIFFLIVSMLIK